MAETLHASLVARFHEGLWRGVLLTGGSGVGKSDLALRCLEEGWRLVADDRVVVWSAAGRAWGRAPAPLGGLLELRGQGMLRTPVLAYACVDAVVALGAPQERQPAPAWITLDGVSVPAASVLPLHASAPARLRRIVERLAHEV